jgi:lipopolysaccharide O-acetyltransferase
VLSRIPGFVEGNGYLLACSNIATTLVRKIYSRYLSLILSAENLEVEPYAFVRGSRHITIGKNFRSRKGLWIEAVLDYEGVKHHPKIAIGSGVSLSRDVHIAAIASVSIGADVLMGSRVMISDHSHGCYNDPHSSPTEAPAYRPLASRGPVVIEDNVWLGDGVVVLPGVTIGFGSIIGANSVVSHDISPMTIAAGNPARPIKEFSVATGRWTRVLGQNKTANQEPS